MVPYCFVGLVDGLLSRADENWLARRYVLLMVNVELFFGIMRVTVSQGTAR